MENKITLKLFLGSFTLAVALLVMYEYYWREVEGYHAGYDDNAELWSHWRGQVDNLTSDDVVILGSSRAHFDINIHLFDSLTGHRPIMLAVPGGSPYYTVEDIVQKSNFSGLLIIGVAPGLFYTLGSGGAARWIKTGRVDFFYKQTYASKFSQAVYQYIDPHFSYLDPDIALKNLLTRLNLPDRDSIQHDPAWPPMVSMDWYRNIRMNPGMETDTVLQNRQTKIWDGDWKNRYADSVDVILSHYSSLVHEFKKKGGRVAFIQAPVTGKYLHYEPILFPRDKYWNALLAKSHVKGYHYEDYPEMKKMNPPEWSHLNRKEADQFTRLLVDLLKQDGLLKP
jgi:hypothetical protein